MSDFSFKAIDPDENVLYEWLNVAPASTARFVTAEGQPAYVEALFSLHLPLLPEKQEVVFLDIYIWGMHYERKRITPTQVFSAERGRPWLVVTPYENATIHQRLQIS